MSSKQNRTVIFSGTRGWGSTRAADLIQPPRPKRKKTRKGWTPHSAQPIFHYSKSIRENVKSLCGQRWPMRPKAMIYKAAPKWATLCRKCLAKLNPTRGPGSPLGQSAGKQAQRPKQGGKLKSRTSGQGEAPLTRPKAPTGRQPNNRPRGGNAGDL